MNNLIITLNAVVLSLPILVLVCFFNGVPEKITISFVDVSISNKWLLTAMFVACFNSWLQERLHSQDCFFQILSSACFFALSPFLFYKTTSIITFVFIVVGVVSYYFGLVISNSLWLAFIGYRKQISGSQISHFPVRVRQGFVASKRIFLMCAFLWSLDVFMQQYDILLHDLKVLYWSIGMFVFAFVGYGVEVLLYKFGPKAVYQYFQKEYDVRRNVLETHEYMYQMGGFYPINTPEIPLIYKKVVDKDCKAVKDLLDNGCDPNTVNHTGFSILMQAVADGSYDVAKLLLERGANPNVVNSLGRSPMCFAANYGYKNMVELLLQYGAQPNLFEYPEKKGPVLVAIANGHVEILKLLLPKISIEKKDGKFLEYEVALQVKNPEIIKLVAEKIRTQGEVGTFLDFTKK